MFKIFCWKPIYSIADLLTYGFAVLFLIKFPLSTPLAFVGVSVVALELVWICISTFKTHKYYKVTEKE